MGTGNRDLNNNDLVEKVKADYIAKLNAGKSDEDALQEIFLNYKEERCA